METKAGLIIFLLKGWQASSILKWSSAERKIFCGQNHVLVVLERQVKIRHFRGKKAFKNSLEAIFIPKSGRGRVTLIFHLLSPWPLKDKGAGGLFLGSYSCCRCKKSHFSQSWLEPCVLGQLWEPLSAPAMGK